MNGDVRAAREDAIVESHARELRLGVPQNYLVPIPEEMPISEVN